MIEKTIDIDRMEQAVQLFGSFDENIKELEKEMASPFSAGALTSRSPVTRKVSTTPARLSMHCFAGGKR